MAELKRNHYVPRMYLERFAQQGRVWVRWRDGKSYASNCINVAAESGFYDVKVGDDEDPPSKAVENALTDVETVVHGVFEAIDQTGEPPEPDTEQRAALATYLALQWTRTPEQRERD